MELPYCYSNGGAEGAFLREKSDCSVISLAVAACVPYVEAARHMRLHGRKWNQGMYSDDHARALKNWRKNSIKKIRPPAKTVAGLKKLIDNFGTYIVGVRGHVFTIRQGRIWDARPPKPNQKVTELWKVG